MSLPDSPNSDEQTLPDKVRGKRQRFSLERFLIWLSTADSDVLDKCPKWERLKYAAFGASVLVPFLFGMMAAAYAVSTLTKEPWIYGGFAVIWGFIIISIDRAILSTYNGFVSFSKKCVQFVLRFTVAILMGVTVSHPLTLLLFKDAILSEIERTRVEEMASARVAVDAEKKELDGRIAQATENLQKQQKRYEDIIAGEILNNNQPVAAPVSVPKEVTTHSSEIENQIKEYKKERDQVQIDLNRFQRTYDEEISGARTGKPGIGPNARAIERDELVWRREEVKRLGGVIADLTRKQTEMSARLLAESAAANAEIEASKRKLEQQKIQLYSNNQEQMAENAKAQIASASVELDRLREEAKKLSADAEERVDALKGEKRLDLMVQTMVLHKIFEKEGGGFALAVYIIIGCLFTLIDTIPLVVKSFSTPGIYDLYKEDKEVKEKESKDKGTLAWDCGEDWTGVDGSASAIDKDEAFSSIKKRLFLQCQKSDDSESIQALRELAKMKLDLIKEIDAYLVETEVPKTESNSIVTQKALSDVESGGNSADDQISDEKIVDATEQFRHGESGSLKEVHSLARAESKVDSKPLLPEKREPVKSPTVVINSTPSRVTINGESKIVSKPSVEIKSVNGNHKEPSPIHVQNEFPVLGQSIETSSSPVEVVAKPNGHQHPAIVTSTPGLEAVELSAKSNGHQHPAKVEPQGEVVSTTDKSQSVLSGGSNGSQKRTIVKKSVFADQPKPRKIVGSVPNLRTVSPPSTIGTTDIISEPTVQQTVPISSTQPTLPSDFLEEPSRFIADQLERAMQSIGKNKKMGRDPLVFDPLEVDLGNEERA